MSVKNNKGDDDFWGILMAMLFFGLIIVLFAKLFIPLLIIFVVYLVYYLNNRVYLSSNKVLIALGAATAFSGFLFFATLGNNPDVAKDPPTISIETDHLGIFEDVGSVDRFNDEVVVEMSDNVLYFLSTSEQKGKDSITIRATENARNPSKEKIKIVVDGGVKRESESGWISLSNQEFPFGETVLTVTASNSAGEVSREITVRKVSVAERCQPYDGDYSKLVTSVRLYCGAWKDYMAKVENGGNNAAKPAASGASSVGGTSSTTSGTGSTCLHYEAGRCWDDLEEEAYAQGEYDKYYGHYGGGYYEGDNCDALCRDILEEAYSQGYGSY